jgi:hypothetical protein
MKTGFNFIIVIVISRPIRNEHHRNTERGGRVINTPASYSGGLGFKSQSENPFNCSRMYRLTIRHSKDNRSILRTFSYERAWKNCSSEGSGSFGDEYEGDWLSSWTWRIALMMEVVNTSETSVSFYETARRSIPKDVVFRYSVKLETRHLRPHERGSFYNAFSGCHVCETCSSEVCLVSYWCDMSMNETWSTLCTMETQA